MQGTLSKPCDQVANMSAIQAGLHTPPHINILAQVLAIRYPFTACEKLSKLNWRVAYHIQNVEKHKSQSERVGTSVFIGYGRSPV